ncbi:MAG: isopeptide-forming domain-containing fimbrial protein [Defluviitaleaceae bacterium]|nr:isopeptide-forming domain-containing fimbrial protein [Defluviitaleaceae bacterium]
MMSANLQKTDRQGVKNRLKRAAHRVLTVCLAASVIAASLGYMAAGNKIQAAPQTFLTPKVRDWSSVNFVNGSFETPSITDTTIPNASKTVISTASAWGKYNQYDMSYVPGWFTVPVNVADDTNVNAYYIEIQKGGSNAAGGFAPLPLPDDTATAAPFAKTQYAELNAVVPGCLYQICNTTPGQQVYYEFYHRARGDNKNLTSTVYDTMNFYLGAPSANMGTANATADDLSGLELIQTCQDNNLAWGHYIGTYTVPTGQTQTLFAFEAICSLQTSTAITAGAGLPAQGNYLDGISLFMPSWIDVTKTVTTDAPDNSYALVGEEVTYTVTATNNGECDSSRTVMTDVLPDGVSFVPGSVTINGAPDTMGLSSFDPATDTVRVNLGAGAAAGADPADGGSLTYTGEQIDGVTLAGNSATITFKALVTGTGRNYGDLIQNQARVDYNDKGLESFNDYTDSFNVSPVVGFTLKNTSILNGTVWVDGNMDGMIGAAGTERRVSGWQVWMVEDSSTDYVTPAPDANGAPLITTTDADGLYGFQAIPGGTYKIVTNYIANYEGTAQTASTDNRASPLTDTMAFIGGVVLSPATMNDTSLYNEDIGMVPTVKITKDAQVNSGAVDDGTPDDPVGISYVDTVTYTITVTNLAVDPMDVLYSDFNVSDELPLNMQIVSTAPAVPCTTGADGRQTAGWEASSLPMGGTTFTITAQAAGLGTMENTANLTYADKNQDSNPTYHYVEVVGFDIDKSILTASDRDESFAFRIDYSPAEGLPVANSFYGVITVAAGSLLSSEHFSNLPPGYYTVTELDNNWRYTIAEGYSRTLSKSVIDPAANAVFNFVNSKTNDQWVGSSSKADNTMSDTTP